MNKYAFRNNNLGRTLYEKHMDAKYNIHSKFCMFLNYGGSPPAEETPAIVSLSTSSFYDGQAVTIYGSGFKNSGATVELNTAANGSGTSVAQTVSSQTSTQINIVIEQGALSLGTVYLIVHNTDENQNSGYSCILIDIPEEDPDYFGITGYGTFSTNPTLPNTHVYYLDANNGDDDTGEGTLISPWQTLSKVQSVMVSGDTVYLMSGNYGAFTETSATGRTDWITFKPYTGNTPIITQIDITYTSLQNSYLRFDGITLDVIAGGNTRGASVTNARYIDIRNCDISYSVDKYTITTSIYLTTCQYAIVYHNHCHSTMAGITLLNTTDSTISNNHIHHLGGGSGIYYGNGNNGENVIIEKNNIYDSLWIEGEEGAPDAANAPHGSGISLQGGNVIIKQNIIHDIGSTAGIRTYTGYLPAGFTNIVIENNLLYDIINGSNGPLQLNDAGTNITVRNNILVGHIRTDTIADPLKMMTGFSVVNIGTDYDGTGIKVYNNIIIGSSHVFDTMTISNNIFWSIRRTGETAWFSSLEGNTIVVPSASFDFDNLIQYFTTDFFNGITSQSDFASEHGLILDYTLHAGCDAIDYGSYDLQPTDSLGTISSSFIQSDGISRNITNHSAGCYEV